MKVIHFVIFIVGLFLVAQSFLTACTTGFYDGKSPKYSTTKSIKKKVTK